MYCVILVGAICLYVNVLQFMYVNNIKNDSVDNGKYRNVFSETLFLNEQVQNWNFQ